MRLQPVTDLAVRDALLAGDLRGFEAAPGWPHDDTHAGLSFLDAGALAYLVIDDDGRVAGECGTKAPPDAAGMVEIGYGLAPHSRGKGLGAAAVGALVELLAARSDVRRIEAEVHVGNPASWRLLVRLGFVETETAANGFARYRLVLPR